MSALSSPVKGAVPVHSRWRWLSQLPAGVQSLWADQHLRASWLTTYNAVSAAPHLGSSCCDGVWVQACLSSSLSQRYSRQAGHQDPRTVAQKQS